MHDPDFTEQHRYGAVQTPFIGGPWQPVGQPELLALSHGVADGSAVIADEDLADEITAISMQEMLDLANAILGEPSPTPDGLRTDMPTVYRNADGEISHYDPTGDLALSADPWARSNEQLASLGVQKAGAAERLGRYGYDPLDGSYEDRPTDDGLRAIPDSGAAARAQLVEAARESQYLPSAAHQTRSENFNRTVVAAPAAYEHADGSAVIGRDGQPLWRERHDLEPEPEFATDQAAFDATDDSREALANEQLRMLGLR